MVGSVNKQVLVEGYLDGKSIPELASEHSIPLSTIRTWLAKEDVLRTREQGIRNAAERGRMGSGLRGKRRKFTQKHCENISAARTRWGDKNAAGKSLKPNGYIEITRGEHKGKSEHVVIMEQRLGRPLKPDECVHHIDENRSNNSPNNLALMTRSGHMRHHCMMQRIRKCQDQ